MIIKAIALDVDGVLTDGTFWWDTAGAELKRFSFRDIRLIEESFGTGEKFVQEREIPVMQKLRRVGLKK